MSKRCVSGSESAGIEMRLQASAPVRTDVAEAFHIEVRTCAPTFGTARVSRLQFCELLLVQRLHGLELESAPVFCRDTADHLNRGGAVGGETVLFIRSDVYSIAGLEGRFLTFRPHASSS